MATSHGLLHQVNPWLSACLTIDCFTICGSQAGLPSWSPDGLTCLHRQAPTGSFSLLTVERMGRSGHCPNQFQALNSMFCPVIWKTCLNEKSTASVVLPMPTTPDHHTGAGLPGTHVALATCPLELEQKPIRGSWRQPAAVCCLAHWEFLVYLNCSSVHLKICWFAWNPDFWNCLKLINLATLEQDDYLWGLGSNCPFWVPHSPPSQPGPLPSPFRNWIGTPQILLLLLRLREG